MGVIEQKRESALLDGTPVKRMYWSIISDYDLKTGLCELIDNAIDISMANESKIPVCIEVLLDAERQLIHIKDNAGGVREDNLRLLVSPGASSNSPDAESIGIFGVGSKRAVIALAESVALKTRHKKQKTFQIDITQDWLETPDWSIPSFEIPNIDSGMTFIELSKLRRVLADSDIEDINRHFSSTYAKFLGDSRCEITVNETAIVPTIFETWAYPPSFPPRYATFDVELPDHQKVKVKITGGLIRDRDAVRENYGVYFYCNKRLIAQELKTREVGYFVTSEAGVPHPDASLCRVIVEIEGPAKLMPWNSSKSGINFDHAIFHSLRPTLLQLVSHFSSLSRRFKKDWPRQVFRHKEGVVEPVEHIEPGERRRLVLPPLPKVNKQYIEVLKQKNKSRLQKQPWTLGLLEAMAAIDVVSRQKLETKDRISLIILDSNFEIALKEFVVHRTDLFPTQSTNISDLFSKRYKVVDIVAKKVGLPADLIATAKHYYELRNKLIHERATVSVAPSDIEIYSKTIKTLLNKLFGLTF